MGYKINYKQEDNNRLDVFLQSIVKESEEVERKLLKDSADRLKTIIVDELRKHKRNLLNRYRVSLSDDVKGTIRTDKFGNKYASVRGGKKTGTLWHIVNDGTLHTRALHFMDRAIDKFDKEINELWNRNMK